MWIDIIEGYKHPEINEEVFVTLENGKITGAVFNPVHLGYEDPDSFEPIDGGMSKYLFMHRPVKWRSIPEDWK